jgi:hypothetical protein
MSQVAEDILAKLDPKTRLRIQLAQNVNIEKQETPSDTREDRKKYKESRKLIRRAKGISNLTGYIVVNQPTVLVVPKLRSISSRP